MTKHTPGPWSMRESATHVTVTNIDGDALFHDDKRIRGVIEDARLIAAAPDLLEALRLIKNEDMVVPADRKIIKAAIAMATGELSPPDKLG